MPSMPSIHCKEAHGALLLLYETLLCTGMLHGSRWGYKTEIHMFPLNEMVAMDKEWTEVCKHGVAKYEPKKTAMLKSRLC